MIMLTEVYKRQTSTQENKDYSLRQILINPQQVMMLREDEKMKDCFKRGKLPSELDERQKFTRLHLNTLNNSSITVVGDMHTTCKKLLGG
jgi:hypothetical protein